MVVLLDLWECFVGREDHVHKDMLDLNRKVTTGFAHEPLQSVESDKDISDTELGMPGYMFRNDRTGRMGGIVIIRNQSILIIIK